MLNKIYSDKVYAKNWVSNEESYPLHPAENPSPTEAGPEDGLRLIN